MTTEEAIRIADADMAEANRRIHWHLSRAASACLQGLMLGHFFEEEMTAAAEWKLKYDAAVRTRVHWMSQ